MSNFYTNVQSISGKILYRGIKNGKRIQTKIDYEPTLYTISKKPTGFKSLDGEDLMPKRFDSIHDARQYLKDFEDVGGSKIFGQTRFEYAFIAEQHKGMVDYDFDKVSVAVVDIEVGSENGFPDPYQANEPITAICIKYLGGHTYVYGCGDFENYDDNVTYVKFRDEYSLCKRFIEDWHERCPDILTGWNTEFFDIPYLINRFRKIIGEEMTKRLSPWNFISERKVKSMGREMITYGVTGVACLDYIQLYKWYAPGGKSQESYKLDAIASLELGERKLSYDEYDSLHDLYKLNFQKFIEYNIKDVELIVRLEEKLKLVEMAVTLGYDTKSNFEDVFAQTRMWDAMTYSYLLEKNIIVPPKSNHTKTEAFEGAYVKEPQVGLHNWVASFDLNSLYPHLMMQYNISPETLIQPEDYSDEMRNILAQNVTVDKLLAKKINTDGLVTATLTPNGQFFRLDQKGFFPQMLEEMYEDRKKFKKLYLQAKQEYENERDESKKYEIEKRIARYNNLQLAKKVSLNSAYGALGSQYFRFYDLRMALAVTTAGQLSIRWIESKINGYMNKLLGTENVDYVIASDTDSIYLRLGELVDKFITSDSKDTDKIIRFMDRVCEDKIQPFIDKSYKELADYVKAFAQKMQMKREGLSDKGIWTAKKRYILNVYNNEGVQYAEPDLKVMGLEMIKSSTPSIVRGKMKEVVKLMVSGTEQDVQDYLAKFKLEFSRLPAEDVSFPRGVNGLKEYYHPVSLYTKGTPIHVKGALLYNHYLEQHDLTKKYPLIQSGEKIKFTYLKMPNPFKDTVISYPDRLPPEFGLDKYIDYELQYEKTFLEPIKVILDCMGWQTEKINSLEDFFA